MRLKLSLFILTFFFIFPHEYVTASGNTSVSIESTYTIDINGKTKVLLQGKLTNETPDHYTSSFQLKLGFKNIDNIKASDSGGSIPVLIDKSNDQSIIDLSFKTIVVGIGNSTMFSLSFDTNDIAKKRGSIWEVNIPGLSNISDYKIFDVNVVAPSSFGTPSYIKPQTIIGKNRIHFTKDQLNESGISLAFGTKQTYAFELLYHLKNPNIYPINTEIALPPSTNYQEVAIDEISSKPINVTEDADGNWLATYSLLPSEKKDIEVKGRVKLSLFPKTQVVDDDELKKYLKEDLYWEVNNEKIKLLAQTLKTPYAIYEYLINNLKYDFSRITDNKPRAGALLALNEPSSVVCLEFTDLFIALARAAGIPAREINGFGFTDNVKKRPLSAIKDILHAWPEYYDKELQTWIMIDPTWGNTTEGVDYFNVLDFDHIVFAIKGKDSEYPIPAGGYKLKENENEKDVKVFFTNNEINETQNIQLKTDIANYSSSIIPLSGSIRISNIGSIVIEKEILTITSKILEPKIKKINTIRIPPYGNSKILLSFDKMPILTNKQDVVTISIAGKTISQSVNISLLYLGKFTWLLFGLIICAGILFTRLFIASIKAWSLFISRRKRDSIVRGESHQA
ncbi:hypothetical protein LBMAG33_2770 [Candidatus Levyibacteriota bacterium]|nr:transglutaminase domain-containing protein [Candidatus Levybacteria bacterium]MSU25925.1 hypothetical protein [Candidatus Levybacteria bacterium]GDX61967.1 hypothetical protein LBMAG33_2770 [Candidatus Levybacteria bacterium]